MPEQQTCAECGAELPANAPQGLCPRCLLGTGMGLLSEGTGPIPAAVAPAASPAPPAAPGTLRYFGDYELLEEIGRGGMGVIYKARQVSLNRVVAVKMLLFGQFASDEVVRRFRVESEAVAGLQHPNIVALHEVGLHQGQHYFSMEYIAGQNLAERARDNPLPPQLAADYLRTIARAVHYAHQHGVLHRDLKPSNVLIDALDQPHVTDFGLARLQHKDSSLTRSEAILGTPNYMAPEQAAGHARQLTTATDVYGLGAILYHLLTGHPPFAGASPVDTLRQVMELEPKAPRAFNPALDADLEAICLKCLEKLPQRRYDSARSLAEDLERWSDHEPITATTPGTLYRFRKFVRRHRAGVAAAAAIVLLLVAGTLVSTLEAIRASRAEKRALTQADKSRQVAGFLQEMLKGVGPSVALGHDIKMLRAILDKTAETVGRALTNQPEVAADLRLTLGTTYSELGELAKAEAMFREAWRLQQLFLGTAHPDLAQTLNHLGNTLQARDDFAGAEALYRRALAMQRLRPANAPARAGTLNNLGSVLRLRGQLAEAAAAFAEALPLLERPPQDQTAELASALANFALLRLDQGQFDAAEQLLRRSLAIRRKLFPEGHPELASALNNLAEVVRERGQPEEAERLLREAVAVRRKLHGAEHPALAEALGNLALALRDRKQLSEAESVCRESLAMFRRVSGETNSDVATTLNNLGLILSTRQDLAGAEAAYREALARRKQLVGPEHPDVAVGLNNLGKVVRQRGRLDEAEALHQEALALFRKLRGDSHPDTALSYRYLGLVARDRGNLASAEALLRQALRINQAQVGKDHPYVITTRTELIAVLQARGDLAAAHALAREAEGTRTNAPPTTK